MSWEPKSGRTLAIPLGDTIKLFQRGSWNETMTLKDPAIKKPFSIISFSPCSRLLVATSGDGFWSLFDAASGYKLISSEQNLRNTVVTGLAWKPNDRSKSLAFCNFEGDLGIVTVSLTDDDMDDVEDIVSFEHKLFVPFLNCVNFKVEAAEREIEDDITSDIDLDEKMPRPESRVSIGTVDGSVMTGR
jgi:WD40 repeat protein